VLQRLELALRRLGLRRLELALLQLLAAAG